MTMAPSVAELLAALPKEVRDDDVSRGEREELEKMFADLARRPMPVGPLRRLWSLGGLQAQITLGYLAHWARSWFGDADRRQRDLLETHLRSALKLLYTMGYLRGAVMKVGQTLANYPDIVPDEFVATLEKLHFEAPPMHFSLLREMVHNELVGDPEEVFASIEKEAFAAASLGQVHRAVLRSGERVAVKIQYPGIARTLRSDFRLLDTLMAPLRSTSDLESLKAQFEDVRRSLEVETDYEKEAEFQRTARALFTEDDGVVVPRTHDLYCTRRVLTMDHVPGVHIHEFLAGNPSQQQRNAFAEKMWLAWYRLYYSGRMSYIDWHPGNFLFLDDGRLGLIDFGCMQRYNDVEWDWMRKAERPLATGLPDDIRAFVREWCQIADNPAERDRLRLSEQFTEWCWRPRLREGSFDFGDEAELRRGFEMHMQIARGRYFRGLPCSMYIVRKELGMRAMLYRLGARIDITPIAERECSATGWQG